MTPEAVTAAPISCQNQAGNRPQPGRDTEEITMYQNTANRKQRPPGPPVPAEHGSQHRPDPAPADPIRRRQLEKSVSWSGRERLRCLWYRLRLTVAEMNYATRQMVELQAPWDIRGPAR
jgi:hypothetical protein